MNIKELKRILDNMMATAVFGFNDAEWYDPLVELGVVEDDDRTILDDSYYDANAVRFARKILDLVT